MTGLDKMTGKIIADAEADAKRILEQADAECAAIRKRYVDAAGAERDRLREQAERECEGLITRAKSSAAMAKRDVTLEARGRLMDETYAVAEKEILQLPNQKYLELLLDMLKGALKRQLEGEKETMELYGEDCSPEVYGVVLNRLDRERYGEQLIGGLQRSVVGKMNPASVAKVRLLPETANITGGLILKCGSVEANCSLEMVFADVRRRTEARVSHVLFDQKPEED